ncbi:MAG: hypothetical protein PQJ46_01200 [Spirochaetales bacterium]|nr:hypothetical protein [Spirochaetales bacterium]
MVTKKILSILMGLLTYGILVSVAPNQIDKEDVQKLYNENFILRSVDSYKDLTISDNGKASSVYKTLKKQEPNFITETIMFIETENADEVISKLEKNLADFQSYNRIPYFSKHNKTTTPLFMNTDIISNKKIEKGNSWFLSCRMKPFNEYEADFTLTKNTNSLKFSTNNTSPIIYEDVEAIAPGNMQWIIEAETVENGVLIYGAGAVKAFDFFGILHQRLSVALEGRSEAFFKWQYQKLTSEDL